MKKRTGLCTINIIGLRIEVDLEAKCFYFYLKEFKKAHRTIEPVEGILIDLDEKDKPLGIELIWH